jgi:hypothetical protein
VIEMKRLNPAFLFLLLTMLPGTAWAASSEDPDWPCIQRLVPRITAAQVWAGPEPNPEAGQGDLEVSRLASQMAARRTPLGDTEKLVEDFAEAQPKEAVNEKLTALFGRTLQIINRDRASIIAGIKRFSQRQRALTERIRETRAQLQQVSGGDTDDSELMELLNWDLRIFDEREKSLTYLCEQRAFALGRTIYFFMEE